MSNPWIDVKYANILSGRLEQYKVKKSNPYLANLRCPICGDSQKNKFKARGYLFQNKGEMSFKCHNCGIACSFVNFLKKLDLVLYDEYTKEHYLNQDAPPRVEKKIDPLIDMRPPKFLSKGSPLKKLKKISQLAWDHPAKTYVLSRKIPNEFHGKLFYCPRFAEWTNSIIPGKIDSNRKDEPRLIIPLLKEDGTLFGYQGRSFDPNTKLRYITIIFDEYTKIFGLDAVNKHTTTYVFEGPIDSMFIPNSIAMLGSDVKLDSSFKDPVFVYDNEPRNLQIVKKIDSMIDKGYNVVIWTNDFPQKDINDMIMAGHDIEHIKIIMDQNTFSGLEAKLQLTKWKKCNDS